MNFFLSDKKKRVRSIISQLNREKYLDNKDQIAAQIEENAQVINFGYKGHTLYMNNEKSALYHLAHSIRKMEKMAEMISLQECRIVFDIGANTGLFSYFVTCRYPGVKVYLFEPDIRLHEVIKMNLGSQADYELHNLAVSNTNGDRLPFYINPASAQTNSLVLESVEVFKAKDMIVQEVTTVTVDSFCEQHAIKGIDVYKIDIQGNELNALRGSHHMLQGTKNLLIEASFAFKDCVETLSLVNQYFARYEVVNEVYFGVDLICDGNRFL